MSIEQQCDNAHLDASLPTMAEILPPKIQHIAVGFSRHNGEQRVCVAHTHGIIVMGVDQARLVASQLNEVAEFVNAMKVLEE